MPPLLNMLDDPAHKPDNARTTLASNWQPSRRYLFLSILTIVFGWWSGVFGLWYSRRLGGAVLMQSWHIILLPVVICSMFLVLYVANRRLSARKRATNVSSANPNSLQNTVVATHDDEIRLIGENETIVVLIVSLSAWFLQLLWALSLFIAPIDLENLPESTLPGYAMISQCTFLVSALFFYYKKLEYQASDLLYQNYEKM